MYRCKICDAKVPARTPRKVLIKRRSKFYPFRKNVQRPIDYIFPETGKKKTIVGDDPGGRGHEIAAEIPVCAKCEIEYRKNYEHCGS